jgi:hypothetical protein
MKYNEYIESLMKKCDDANKEMFFEIAGVCGKSDIGTKRCPNHGHLSLSVSPETVRDVAFTQNCVPILISVPRDIFNQQVKELNQEASSGTDK